MRYHVVALKTTVGNNERLLEKTVALQHCDQCADLILFRLRLYHRINESTGQKVIQRRYMELIHPVWNPVVADKGRRRRIAGEIDCCTVHRKKTVSVEHLRIDTSGIKRIKDSAEHSRVDLSAALADGGRGDFNPGGMENLI